MLHAEMSKSKTLQAIVFMWRNQRAELRTCATLLAALKQWLEDERANHLGELERAREEARSQQRLG
eukprot:1599983-Alexandrium_andersonii.AAC.1